MKEKFLFSLIVLIVSFFAVKNSYNLEKTALLSVAAAIISFIIVWLIDLLGNRLSLRSIKGISLGLVISSIVFFAIKSLIESLNVVPFDVQKILYPLIFLTLFYVGVSFGISKSRESEYGQKRYYSKYQSQGVKILDTSVIIDGRIADVAAVGFINGTLIIPKFIIKELQYIADSSDSVKKVRGRRGLDVLKKMQEDVPNVNIRITSHDFRDIVEADLKLVELAKKLKGEIITNDFNLNKVANLQNVKVLNLNQLSNALKPIVLPGEKMKILVIKEGKENNQGVGYLDDGTMVVVDDAKDLLGRNIEVSVTSVIQTPTGRMIFSKASN